MFSPRMWYLSLNTSTWSTAKKKEWHSPKTNLKQLQRQLKLFTPLLLVIKAFQIWKNFRSEFHSQINDFDLPTYFTFLGSEKKSRETWQKHIAYAFNCSRPFKFYLLWIRSKKIHSSELHEQTHDSCMPIGISKEHFYLTWNRAGKQDIDVLPILSILHTPFTCYQYSLKKFTALNSIHKRTTLTCQYISLLSEEEKEEGNIRQTNGQQLNLFTPLLLAINVF